MASLYLGVPQDFHRPCLPLARSGSLCVLSLAPSWHTAVAVSRSSGAQPHSEPVCLGPTGCALAVFLPFALVLGGRTFPARPAGTRGGTGFYPSPRSSGSVSASPPVRCCDPPSPPPQHPRGFVNYLLKDNCFTEFCCFLSNLNMNQP